MKSRREALKTAVLGTAAIVAAPRARAASAGISAFLERWEKSKAFTLQVADAMPAGDYTFKPKPEMRSYGELMGHLAANNAFYISRFTGGELPDNLRPLKQFDKDTVKNYMAASFDFCAGVIRNLTDEKLEKSYPGRPNTPAQPGWDWVMYAFIHTAHHRGYADVYLREKGITPPRYSV